MFPPKSEYEKITDKLIDEIEERYNEAKDFEIRKLYDKRRKKQKALQKDCPHLETVSHTNDSDYHNNISWDEDYCKTCGKLLSRV